MDRFIVGTGRCGSTLLSRMLALHPDALSVFEFFNGLDIARRFDPAPVPGAAFADLISQEHPFVSMVLKRGYEVPEIVYPFGPGARFSRDDGLPWLLVSALSRLSDAPDALYDAALAFARGLPTQPPALHYRAFFEWLGARFERPCWIEKSGSSIDFVGALSQLFPEARFLHLHRDGREAALSMREHHAFRLAIALFFQLDPGGARSNQALAQLDPGGPGAPGDPIAKLIEARPAAEHFGRFWTGQVERGMAALAALPAERQLDVRFEELVSRPRPQLERIAAFFELDSAHTEWLDAAVSLVKGVPPARAPALPAAEREALEAACHPGQILLERGG